MAGEVSRVNGKKGGRVAGAANKLTRSLANELARQGCDGLSVMVENMLFWKDKAKSFGEQLEKLVVPEGNDEARAEALKLLRNFLAARENSQRCAVDVAPYTNPRLQSITINKTSVHTEISMKLTPASDDADRTYRGAVVPFVKRAAD
jgi:hypothetical protein